MNKHSLRVQELGKGWEISSFFNFTSMKIVLKISFLDTRTNRSIKCIDKDLYTSDVFSYCTVMLYSNKMS
jgi:hypothetical protein